MRVLIICLLTALTFPIVNGDEHEVQLVDPDGQNISHSPSMTTTILVLPR
jgi:hypothetical protein